MRPPYPSCNACAASWKPYAILRIIGSACWSGRPPNVTGIAVSGTLCEAFEWRLRLLHARRGILTRARGMRPPRRTPSLSPGATRIAGPATVQWRCPPWRGRARECLITPATVRRASTARALRRYPATPTTERGLVMSTGARSSYPPFLRKTKFASCPFVRSPPYPLRSPPPHRCSIVFYASHVCTFFSCD